ncbi:MAG: hypothetical protein ABID40_03115 [Candidatus Bipolaricaulota bacterium]
MTEKPETFQPEPMTVSYAGYDWIIQPFKSSDPYEHRLLVLEGLGPIHGGCAPTLDAYLAMLKARVNAGLMTKELYDQVLGARVQKEEQVWKSDERGDATEEVETFEVEQNISTFASGPNGEIGLLAYTLIAATRECLSTSGVFMGRTEADKEAAKVAKEAAKEAAKAAKAEGKAVAKPIKESKPKQALRERLNLDIRFNPGLLALYRNGEPLMAPDLIEKRTIHPKGPQGRRSAIKQFEVVNLPWESRVIVSRAVGSNLGWDDLITGWERLPSVGWGAGRSQGAGSCRLKAISDPYRGRL